MSEPDNWLRRIPMSELRALIDRQAEEKCKAQQAVAEYDALLSESLEEFMRRVEESPHAA